MPFKKLLLLGVLAFSFVYCSQQDAADKIYYHARIWTGDTSQPWAEVLAIKGNKILYVGKDEKRFRSKHTEMIDLEGRFIVPGFIDNHTHFLSGGYNLSGVDLRKARSPQEFISILKAYCLQHPDDRWILGGDWDHEAWGGQLPDRHWIDSITGNHPVFISRYDGHMALANTKAMELAGIHTNTTVPAGGEMIKDKYGVYTGVMKDEAMNLVTSVIPPPSDKELDEYLQAAVQHAFKNGVTQIHDMGSFGGWLDLATYRRNHALQKLDLRIYSFVPLNSWYRLDSFCKKEGKGDDLLRWGGLKGFMDGSLGSTTAWFYQPYLDHPKSSGFNITDTTMMRNWVLAADSAGLQVAVHAIGDRANDFILNVFEEAEKKLQKIAASV